MQKVRLVFEGGTTTVDALVNPAAVLWLRASKDDEIGSTIIGLVGGRKDERERTAGIESSLTKTIELLGIETVRLLRHDLAGRRAWDGNPVEVAAQNVRLVHPAHNYYTVEFIDGSTISVKTPGSLAD